MKRLLIVLFALGCVDLPGQVTNDTCGGAINITEGIPVLGSNVGATVGPDPVACNAGSDVWYAVVLNCNTQYLASTCDAATTFDTVLSVWSAPSGCGGLALVGCNDNNCGSGGPVTASRVIFTATAGGL